MIDDQALQSAGMIDWTRERSRVAEEFRIVQNQILRSAFAPETAFESNSNLVMLTSARPGEGKSFASLNIAASIARQRDREVLLVDIDSKADAIGRKLGLAEAAGLLNLVSDPSLTADSLLIRTALPKLSILPVGTDPERRGELFATRQMARVIRDLGQANADRLVIIDAPPCLSSSEPSLLAPIVGQIVLIVEAERTQRQEVEAALDLIQACPNLTLLLNKIQLSTKHSFGAYGSKYYYAS
ncbi:MAG: AAA family ATPase [Acetobacteraceae bacterium]|nr:AAA family ATPase [Acetobacteraceae bacterium]MBV8521718.1 AAA family ATPase [Acetobacteraceae bacterium]